MTTTEKIALTAAVVTVVTWTVAQWLNLVIARNAVRRQKKQATLDAWSKVRDDRRKDRMLLGDKFRGMHLGSDNARALLTEPERADEKFALESYLNSLERIATGARMGIYDVDVIYQIGRGAICQGYERYSAYVVEARKLDAKSVYANLEWLKGKLEEKHNPEKSAKGTLRGFLNRG